MNQKGIAPIVIIFIIAGILVLGGGGYYAVKKYQRPSVQVCTQEAKQCPGGSYVSRTESNCEFAPCPEVKPDETADWNTHRNEEYGLEIRYPSDWMIIKEEIGYVTFADKEEAEINRTKRAGEIMCSVGMFFYDNKERLPLYDWVIGKWGKPENRESGKISEVKINDLEGIRYEFMSMGTETNVLFSKENKVIDVQTTFKGCDNLNEIFDQMLSTFRFLK